MLRKLRVDAIDPSTMLWHYTSGAALLDILRSNTLFSTQVACLNDSREIRYPLYLFREAIGRRKATLGYDHPLQVFLNEVLSYFDENPVSPNHVGLANYVTCFSESRDDLSQWRAYAGGENGYALGFRAKDLSRIENCFLGRVAYYDEQEHGRLVEEVVDATIKFFDEGVARESDNKER